MSDVRRRADFVMFRRSFADRDSRREPGLGLSSSRECNALSAFANPQ